MICRPRLDQLRRAQRDADSARAPPGVRAGIALSRADFAVQLNDPAVAERLYTRAEALYRQTGDRTGEAEAQEGRGQLFLDRDNYARAQELLQAAIRTQLGAGNQRAAALTRLSLGRLAVERGDTAAGRRQTARAAADLDRLGDPVAAAAAFGERAAIEAGAGLPAVAESLYRAGIERLKGRLAPEVAWRLHAGLALARREQGAADEAARELRTALTEVERPGRSLALAERRSAFLADKSDLYAQLALIERARNRPAAVFEVSERMRAREMLELLARGRIAPPADTAADLIAREQDLRRRLAELTHAVEGDTGGVEALRGTDLSTARSSREVLRRAQDAYAELLLEVRERAPRHSALLSIETAGWHDVARRLRPDQAFLEYLVSDSGSLALVVVRDTMAVVDLGIGRRDLGRLIEFARGTLQPPRSQRPDSLWRGPLRQLDQYLIAPVEAAGLLDGKARLVLVPHAELHYLPFAALLDGDRFLVERYEVTVTPSASVWLALGDRPAGRPTTGLLALAPRPEALKASREEVAAIGRVAGADALILAGSAASEEAFRREAPTRRVLHLATFGLLNKENPLFSYLELGRRWCPRWAPGSA